MYQLALALHGLVLPLLPAAGRLRSSVPLMCHCHCHALVAGRTSTGRWPSVMCKKRARRAQGTGTGCGCGCWPRGCRSEFSSLQFGSSWVI